MEKFLKTMDNGWEIDFGDAGLMDDATGRLIFGFMNGKEEAEEEWEDGGEFMIFAGPEVGVRGKGELCDQHLPNFSDKMSSVIGDIAYVETMECGHDIQKEMLEQVGGFKNITFSQAVDIIRQRLVAAGMEEELN